MLPSTGNGVAVTLLREVLGCNVDFLSKGFQGATAWIDLDRVIRAARPAESRRVTGLTSILAAVVQPSRLEGDKHTSQLYRLNDRHWSAKFSANFCG
jgi:hypothetical protein